MRRRHLLGLLGVVGASGCLRLEGSTTATSTASTDVTQQTSATVRTSAVERSAPTETTEASSEDRSLTVSSDWRQFSNDAQNTGHHPGTTGPTGLVEQVWEFSRQTAVPDYRDRQDGDEWSTFIPVIADGTVYVSSQDNNIYAIDAETGSEQWRFSMQPQRNDPSRKGTPAVANGTVFAEGPGGRFYALDAETGSLQWRHPFLLEVSHIQPTVDGDTIYYEGGKLGVIAVNASDGSIKWNRDDFGWTNSTTVGAETVFVAQNGPADHRLYALDEETGETRWTLDGPSITCSFVDGIVYTTSSGESDSSDGPPALFAVDAADGTVVWQTELPAETPGFNPPAVANGTVFVGTVDGTLYAFDAATGGQTWRYETVNNSVKGAPVVVDGHVYFSTAWDGAVTCVTADDGTRKWTYPLAEAVYTPTVVDGVVLVGDNQGRVHALAETA